MENQQHQEFMQEAISLSWKNLEAGEGGPFGAVIVKDSQIIAKAYNQVVSTNDPTAHAEIVAIRQACQTLNTFQLEGCLLYTSCEPCPMCLGAIYWSRLDRIYYANTKADAAQCGFDDRLIYEEIDLPIGARRLAMIPLMREKALLAFQAWLKQENQIKY